MRGKVFYLTGFNVLFIKYLTVREKQYSHHLALCYPVNKTHHKDV